MSRGNWIKKLRWLDNRWMKRNSNKETLDRKGMRSF